MSTDGSVQEQNSDITHQSWTISLHTFSNLSHVSPVVFVYLLKECYIHGKCKARLKFQSLLQTVRQVLYNAPRPGPALFVARCLYVLPIFELYCVGFSHLIISALRHRLKTGTTQEDLLGAKSLAAQLFLKTVGGNGHDEGVLIKILDVFDIKMESIEKVMFKVDLQNGNDLDAVQAFVEQYIFELIELQSYLTAVTLIKHFSLHRSAESFLFKMMESKDYTAAERWATLMGKPMLFVLVQQYADRLLLKNAYDIMKKHNLKDEFQEVYLFLGQSGESFLFKMMESNEYKEAERWAALMGKSMLCVLVQQYIDRLLLKNAYDVIKKHNLNNEFPEVYRKGKESSLKKLAEKGCWDLAESKANSDKQLLENLVHLAMEAGYFEKVEELCDRYSLKGFANVKELQENFQRKCFLNRDELALEDIIWVNEINGLHDATCLIERCELVGIDCEWRPVYEKGKKPKVSIMQIASERMVHIFDLIKLFQDVPDSLDDCLTRIFHSSSILKLGYNFQCDAKQLARSYGDLECFKHYEMLLDIQNLFNEPRGGLSSLAKKILGAELDKTRQSSNWEQRPLTPEQLEYAALDAAVLMRIFSHVRDHSPPAGVFDGHNEIEWKSHIVHHMDMPRTDIKESDAGIDEPSELS